MLSFPATREKLQSQKKKLEKLKKEQKCQNYDSFDNVINCRAKGKLYNDLIFHFYAKKLKKKVKNLKIKESLKI